MTRSCILQIQTCLLVVLVTQASEAITGNIHLNYSAMKRVILQRAQSLNLAYSSRPIKGNSNM